MLTRIINGPVVFGDSLNALPADVFYSFQTLAAQLNKNIKESNLFGSTENLRNERSRIFYELNLLSFEHFGYAFNDWYFGPNGPGR